MIGSWLRTSVVMVDGKIMIRSHAFRSYSFASGRLAKVSLIDLYLAC